MQFPESIWSKRFNELLSFDAGEMIVSLRCSMVVVVVDAAYVMHGHHRRQKLHVVGAEEAFVVGWPHLLPRR